MATSTVREETTEQRQTSSRHPQAQILIAGATSDWIPTFGYVAESPNEASRVARMINNERAWVRRIVNQEVEKGNYRPEAMLTNYYTSNHYRPNFPRPEMPWGASVIGEATGVTDIGKCWLDQNKASCGWVAAGPIINRVLKGFKLLDEGVELVDGAIRGAVNRGGSGGTLFVASRAASEAADNLANYSVKRKHLPGAGGTYAKFAGDIDMRAAIKEALLSEDAIMKPNLDVKHADDAFVITTDLGRTVGSSGETGIKAVVTFDGHVLSAYPVNP